MPETSNVPPRMPSCYKITVEGKIDASWSDWLGGMRLISRKEADDMILTTLSGAVADQAALRGLLNRLWDLNLVVRAVQQVDPAKISNEEQGGFYECK